MAGATDDDALAVARALTADRLVTLDHLGEDTTEREQADATVAAYERILAAARATRGSPSGSRCR